MVKTKPRKPRSDALPNAPEDRKVLKDMISTEQIAEGFEVTPLTILAWRTNKGLPYVEIPGDERVAIRFPVSRVIEWAKKVGKRFRVPVLKD